MNEKEKPSLASRLGLLVFIAIFIGTAAWGGYVLAKNANQNRTKSSADPIEDRSLFGR